MPLNGPTSFTDRFKAALSFSLFAINGVVIGFVIYYEFVMKKRRLNLFNTLYLVCHTCLTMVYVTSGATFWFDGQTTGNSWLNFLINFFFETFMATYVAIMYIKTKGLLTLRITLHRVAKGLSITCFVLIFFAILAYLVSSTLVTFNNGLDTPLSVMLINVINVYFNYVSGSIVAALDIFYLLLFRQFLTSKANGQNSSHSGTGAKEKKAAPSRSEDNLNLRVISLFGGLSSAFSILSLLLYVLSPVMGGTGYLPVFVPANVAALSILGMKLCLDRYWIFALDLARGDWDKKTRSKGSSEPENTGNVISSIKFTITAASQEQK